MRTEHIKKITPYQDINVVLDDLVQGIESILGKNLIGIYLFGSLATDDFNSQRSDIDLSVVIKDPITKEEGESIKKLHLEIEKTHQKWAERIECSYTPLNLFQNTLPPKSPRPYFGAGIFYFEAQYGNEWLINNYLLYHTSITLLGPDFKTLVKLINIRDVQKACIRDLFKEWEPKINDHEWLENNHYQSYIVLNLCRIIYTVMNNAVGSKTVSSTWVKNKYAPEWKDLIDAAYSWHYGIEMRRQEDIIRFIKFVVNKVNEINIEKV